MLSTLRRVICFTCAGTPSSPAVRCRQPSARRGIPCPSPRGSRAPLGWPIAEASPCRRTGGVLAYRPIGETQLTWFDRGGRLVESIGSPGLYRNPALSSDEKRVAVNRLDPATGTADISRLTRRGPVPVPFTFDPVGRRQAALVRLMAAASSSGRTDGRRRRSRRAQVSMQGVERRRSGRAPAARRRCLWRSVRVVSRRASLLYEARGQGKGIDLWTLPLTGDRKPVPFTADRTDEGAGPSFLQMAWIAYVSNETRAERKCT